MAPVLYALPAQPPQACITFVCVVRQQQGHAVLRRGTVIGILKAFLGLSGSFFTTVYVSFLDPDAVSFLMMLAIVPSAIVLTCSCFVNYVPYIQVEPHTKV